MTIVKTIIGVAIATAIALSIACGPSWATPTTAEPTANTVGSTETSPTAAAPAPVAVEPIIKDEPCYRTGSCEFVNGWTLDFWGEFAAGFQDSSDSTDAMAACATDFTMLQYTATQFVALAESQDDLASFAMVIAIACAGL
jgi:hypothetical protein